MVNIMKTWFYNMPPFTARSEPKWIHNKNNNEWIAAVMGGFTGRKIIDILGKYSEKDFFKLQLQGKDETVLFELWEASL